MSATIEYCHKKILLKIQSIKAIITKVSNNIVKVDQLNIDYAHLLSQANEIENDYYMSITTILGDYYVNIHNEQILTRNYYNAVNTENTIHKIHIIARQISRVSSYYMDNLGQFNIDDRIKLIFLFNEINAEIDKLLQTDISLSLERANYEFCDCGAPFSFDSELFELKCDNCGNMVRVISTAKNVDSIIDALKTRSTYKPSRHYRFWIERLQALENKKFNKSDLDNIEYIIRRDGYKCADLTCEDMRMILKDSRVKATKLNNHTPLLVTMFGGRAPPRLSFHENYNISIKFNKITALYDEHIARPGNKPYYPYFIYKIIEHEFRNNPEKKRLLNYIHLQSRETINKNDGYFQIICKYAKPEDDLVYNVTDISRKYFE